MNVRVHVTLFFTYEFWATWFCLKRPIHSQLNWAILLCDVIPDRKNWVNCAVLTGNNAGLRTALYSRLSHRELRRIPQFPQFTCRHHDGIISFLAIYSADEHRMTYSFSNTTSYTALFLSTIVTRTRRHTELIKSLKKLMGNLCCAREYSVQFFVQFFTQLNCAI
jgi:hypothetical protein